MFCPDSGWEQSPGVISLEVICIVLRTAVATFAEHLLYSRFVFIPHSKVPHTTLKALISCFPCTYSLINSLKILKIYYMLVIELFVIEKWIKYSMCTPINSNQMI